MLIVALLALTACGVRPRLMVHVMPWFSAPPVSKEWGWHWTMGKLNPAKGELASHFSPMIGPYDSGDPYVVEYQTLSIKIAGFDGMLVDWYGDRDRYDYLPNHRATEKLFAGAKKSGLTFAVVYEDQTVPNLISGGVFKKEDAVSEGKALLARAEKAWFHSPTYEKIDGKPLVMVFGPQYYAEADWKTMLPDVSFYTLHHRRASAQGAYDWPLPGPNWQEKRAEIASQKVQLIPVAFPRFQDYYKAAGVNEGYGLIPDREGKTYEETLREAIRRGAPIVQVATWNDWGEGTQIEPSKEFGYRDLESTQRLRRETIDPTFSFTPADLRLPARLYALRKIRRQPKKLDKIAELLTDGNPKMAKRLLDDLEPDPATSPIRKSL